MAARKAVKKRGASIVAKVQEFMDRRLAEMLGAVGRREVDEEGEMAPVLRPRVGRRWNF